MCLAFFMVASALADNQVVTDPGDGSGANQLRAKLALAQSGGGGTITFNVGTATIALTSGVLPVIYANVTIDGGNVITLSGNNGQSLVLGELDRHAHAQQPYRYRRL